MPLVRAGGFEIDVTDEGAGPPVVALHSSGMSRRQWGRLSGALRGTHRVLAPDFVGYGASGPWTDDGTFVLEDDARLVLALLGTLGEPAHLVGHSYGGLVALRAAQMRPAAARSLVLYEPVAFAILRALGDEEALRDLARVDAGGRTQDPRTGGDETWLEGFVDFWSGPGAWKALPEPARASFLKVGRKTFAEVYSLLEDRTSIDAFRAIDLPTLLLTGERSPLAARRVCAALASTLPRAKVTTIAGAGHMGPLTHADDVNGKIADFLRAAS